MPGEPEDGYTHQGHKPGTAPSEQPAEGTKSENALVLHFLPLELCNNKFLLALSL
jgi:hypothetical protein